MPAATSIPARSMESGKPSGSLRRRKTVSESTASGAGCTGVTKSEKYSRSRGGAPATVRITSESWVTAMPIYPWGFAAAAIGLTVSLFWQVIAAYRNAFRAPPEPLKEAVPKARPPRREAVLLLGAAILLATRSVGECSPAPVADEILRAEQQHRNATASALRTLEPLRASLTTFAVSSDLLTEVVGKLAGIEFKEPQTGITFVLESIRPQFSPGFPRVAATVRLNTGGQPLTVEAEGVLMHELVTGGMQLRFALLSVGATGLQPLLAQLSGGDLLGRLNSMIPPLDLPMPKTFEFTPPKQTVKDQWVKVPNGRVKLHFKLPPPPKLTIQWQPFAAFFDDKGLRILARVSTRGQPAQPVLATPPEDAPAPAAEELRADLDAWPRLPEGASYFVRLPFGNGFEARLDRGNSATLKAGLSRIRAEWRGGDQSANRGLGLTAKVSTAGRAKLHVHGNAPRPWGVRIASGKDWGPTAEVTALEDVTAALTYEQATREFALRLESPAEMTARLDVSNIPDDLERALNGIKIPLPVKNELYRMKLPAVANPPDNDFDAKRRSAGRKGRRTLVRAAGHQIRVRCGRDLRRPQSNA